MKRALLAVGAVLAGMMLAPAAEAAPRDTDLLCGFASVTDQYPEAPDDYAIGVIWGGPVLEDGTLTCTIQVGGAIHENPDNGARRSATGTDGRTLLDPVFVSYQWASMVPIYLCDQFTDAHGMRYYYDETTSSWTTSSSANCRLAISVGTDDPVFNPVQDVVEALDPVLCQVLRIVRGVPGIVETTPEGDLYVLGELTWDCPPYGPDTAIVPPEMNVTFVGPVPNRV